MITVLFKKKQHSVTKRDWSISAACFSLCQDPVSIGSNFFPSWILSFSPQKEKGIVHMLILFSQDLVERCYKLIVIHLMVVLFCSRRVIGHGVFTYWWTVSHGGIPQKPYSSMCLWPLLKMPMLIRTNRTSRQMPGHIFRCNATLNREKSKGGMQGWLPSEKISRKKQ